MLILFTPGAPREAFFEELAEIAAFLFSPIQDNAGGRHLGQTGDLTLFASVLLDQNIAGLRIDNEIG